MNASRCLRLLFAGIAFLLPATHALTHPPPSEKEFEPSVGQQGKDVVWVPTSQALVDKMLDIAKVTPNDVVI